MLRWGKRFTRTAGLATLLALWPGATAGATVTPAPGSREAHRWSGRAAGKPAYLWLWYADGKSPQPEDGPYCAGLPPPPAFQCTYGTSIDDCQRQVQGYLDLWYANFNLVFTFSRPPSGDYYIMMITSQGAWCEQSSDEAGVAPFNCNDNPGLAAFAFECGKNAHACATMIAHEHGHLVGLEHTLVTTDVMNQAVLSTATGFADQGGRTLEGLCQGTQNSYQQMLTALGAWPGAAKPSPFAATTPDAAVADAPPEVRPTDAADATAAGGTDAPPAAAGIDAGVVTTLGGFDALTRPPLPTADAAGGPPSTPHGGCDMTGQTATAWSVIVGFLCLLVAAFTRSRGRFRRYHRARPAGEPLPCAAPVRSPSAGRARGR